LNFFQNFAIFFIFSIGFVKLSVKVAGSRDTSSPRMLSFCAIAKPLSLT
jgi:hypothetical protein